MTYRLRHRFLLQIAHIAVLTSLLACSSATEAVLPDADARILFVGNSLTEANNLPGLVATIAKAAGHSLEALGRVAPNYSLEEHWQAGTPELIRELRPDVVVFQQGPSSLNESRVHLLAWTDSFAPVVREAGAKAGFLMVWPETRRVGVFDAVRDNYRAAAERAGGLFIPAGEAWRPADMVPGDGRNPEIHLDPAVAALLQKLADAAVKALPVSSASPAASSRGTPRADRARGEGR